MIATLPLTLDATADMPAYPHSHARPPEPALVPWPMKPMATARSGAIELPDGRACYWIRHEVLAGVTPRMLVWWFSHLEGDIEVDGRWINRYRAWHPHDHVHASYARRLPDGRIGPGAQIRLREYLGGNKAYEVNVVSDIEKLDEEGFIHNPRVHGLPGLARMEYTFKRVQGGTQYDNCLIIGGKRGWQRAVTPLMRRVGFDHARGIAWLRHNIEEVGLFEHFLPGLYRKETGLEE